MLYGEYGRQMAVSLPQYLHGQNQRKTLSAVSSLISSLGLDLHITTTSPEDDIVNRSFLEMLQCLMSSFSCSVAEVFDPSLINPRLITMQSNIGV